jgi:hypothetical protein
MQPRARIGSEPAAGGGSSSPGTLDIASAIVSMLPGLVAFFKGIFGNYQYSTDVRWLTQQYQYYVLGDGSATGTHSSTGINEKFVPEAQTWFTAVLGVPIYDRQRLHALMGTRVSDGASLNISDDQKVANYLRSDWTDTQGQDPAKVMRAVQIAKQFRWGTIPGSWAKYGVPADQPEVISEQSGSGGNFFSDAAGKPNYLLWGGIAAAAAALYFFYEDSNSQ